MLHTKNGMADKFIEDIKEIARELMKNPEKVAEGKMALYATSQKIPDRSIVGDFTRLYLDSLCYTPKK